jgi:hypothetical protein
MSQPEPDSNRCFNISIVDLAAEASILRLFAKSELRLTVRRRHEPETRAESSASERERC